jgi:hypothetical protein
MGASVHRHQATSGDVRRLLYQVRDASGDVGLRPATAWS